MCLLQVLVCFYWGFFGYLLSSSCFGRGGRCLRCGGRCLRCGGRSSFRWSWDVRFGGNLGDCLGLYCRSFKSGDTRWFVLVCTVDLLNQGTLGGSSSSSSDGNGFSRTSDGPDSTKDVSKGSVPRLEVEGSGSASRMEGTSSAHTTVEAGSD